MKINHYLTGMVAALLVTVNAGAQSQPGIDSTGLPGDNFSLQGALTMFQKASSPEDFEKMLNAENNHVNNLDLNGDGEIDYIRVVDNTKKNAHALVLQDVVSETESQDIAVIELEKTGDETAVVQIIGDEDIFGEEVIIEPSDGGNDQSFIDNPNNYIVAHGPNVGAGSYDPTIVVNVWMWPSVRFMYAPIYSPWISPWQWRHYPVWWRPWRPFAWHVWHPWHRPYYAHCVIANTHRVAFAHRIYGPHRMTSVTVRTRNTAAINNYRVTRTRTTVTGPGGRHGVNRTRTTVSGPRGHSHSHSGSRRH